MLPSENKEFIIIIIIIIIINQSHTHIEPARLAQSVERWLTVRGVVSSIPGRGVFFVMI